MEDILTWVLPIGYVTCRGAKGDHSRSLCIFFHDSPFVASSAIPVNIENSAKVMDEPGNRRWSPADLREARVHSHPSLCLLARIPSFVVPSVVFVKINKGIIEVMNKPCNQRPSPVYPREARKLLRRLEHDQLVAAADTSQPETVAVLRCGRVCWKELSTKSKGRMMTYRLNSSRRLCSATSPGRESRCSSSATIRERRSSTLFPTVMVPCRCVGRGRILTKGS